MNYDDTKFWVMLKNYGIKRILTSIDIKAAIVLSVALTAIIGMLGLGNVALELLSPIFAATSATMVAAAIAGLAIIASMSDPDFIAILKKCKVYDNILFIYWYSAAVSMVSIFINIIGYLIPKIPIQSWIIPHNVMECIYCIPFNYIMFWLALFATLYSLFTVFLAVGTTMRYGLYRGIFVANGSENNNIIQKNLVVGFRPKTIDITSGECVEVSLFMRNMGTENVVINKITVEFPPEIEVYESDGSHIVELTENIELSPKESPKDRWGRRYNIEYVPDKNAPLIKHSHVIISVEIDRGYIIEKEVRIIMRNNG